MLCTVKNNYSIPNAFIKQGALHRTKVISDHCNDPLVLGVYNCISDAWHKAYFSYCYAIQLFSYTLCLCIMELSWPEMLIMRTF